MWKRRPGTGVFFVTFCHILSITNVLLQNHGTMELSLLLKSTFIGEAQYSVDFSRENSLLSPPEYTRQNVHAELHVEDIVFLLQHCWKRYGECASHH